MKITASVLHTLNIVLVVLGCAATCTSLAADLNRPVMLVATSQLAGSGLDETVLFAAPLPNGMHIGFIVNRPTDVTLAQAFPKHRPSRKVVDPIYFGGPNLAGMLFAAVPTPPQNAGEVLQLMPGLALVSNGEAIDRIIETTPNAARYFVGLFAWPPGVLDEEVRAGAWDVSPADASAVFSARPATIWKSLSRGGVRLDTLWHVGRSQT